MNSDPKLKEVSDTADVLSLIAGLVLSGGNVCEEEGEVLGKDGDVPGGVTVDLGLDGEGVLDELGRVPVGVNERGGGPGGV